MRTQQLRAASLTVLLTTAALAGCMRTVVAVSGSSMAVRVVDLQPTAKDPLLYEGNWSGTGLKSTDATPPSIVVQTEKQDGRGNTVFGAFTVPPQDVARNAAGEVQSIAVRRDAGTLTLTATDTDGSKTLGKAVLT